SNGKTTTKEMIASILRAWQGNQAVVATRGNLNNDIGLPLSLLRLTSAHQASVFELGMNHPGEIALLADIARPTIALVNNAQREHQEFMHSVDAVARENGTVLLGLGASGVAVYPGDDHYADLWRDMAGHARSMCFGFDARYPVHADEIRAEPAHTRLRFHTPVGTAVDDRSTPRLGVLIWPAKRAACALASMPAIPFMLTRFVPNRLILVSVCILRSEPPWSTFPCRACITCEMRSLQQRVAWRPARRCRHWWPV